MCSPTPPGDRGMISTAHCEQWQLNISTNVVLPWFRFPPPFFFCVFSRPSERIGFIFTRAFTSGRFASAMLPPSLLFDLAPLGWEAGAPDTACVQSESVRRMPGYWGHARVGRSVRKPPHLPPSCRERKKEGKHEDTSQVILLRHRGFVALVQTHTGGQFGFSVIVLYPRVQGGLNNFNLTTNVSLTPTLTHGSCPSIPHVQGVCMAARADSGNYQLTVYNQINFISHHNQSPGQEGPNLTHTSCPIEHMSTKHRNYLQRVEECSLRGICLSTLWFLLPPLAPSSSDDVRSCTRFAL